MSKEFDDFMDNVDKLGNEDVPKLGYDVELHKEISDEEIERFADKELGTIRTDFDFGVIQGMKWYREKLKQL